MVQELKRCRTSVTGISEAKWFWQAVYDVVARVHHTPFSTSNS